MRKKFLAYLCLSFIFLNSLTISLIYADQKYWSPNDPPKAHYKIDAKIILSDKLVQGNEKVTFTNDSNKEISILAFEWSISDFRSIEVTVAGKALILQNIPKMNLVASPLFYKLLKPIKPGSTIDLDVIFSATNLFGDDTQEIKMIKWFPRLWWDGLPNHDSFEVKLDVPSGYALAISGVLNKSTDYYESEGVKTCGVYLGKGLKTESRMVGEVLITSLFTENGSECAKLCLETAVDVVRFYKKWLGFYPFKFLSIIPGALEPWGGYPFASGIVVIHGQEKFDSKPLLHWQWITAHEIGHEYWGEYVMDNDVPAWLWIGMGIYADREYTLFRNLGMDKHTGLMKRYISGILNRYDTTVDIPAEQFKKIEYDHNNVVVHGKGYSIISALESVVGKKTFEKIYKKCLEDFGGKILGYKDFWRICEQESGENLNWFFDQWVRSNKFLSYQISSQESIPKQDHYISTIKVECIGSLKMPIPVKATFEDGSSQIKSTNRHFEMNVISFESKSKLKEVILDPENKLAMLKTAFQMTPEELVDAIIQLSWTNPGEKVLTLYKRANDYRIKNPRPWFKLGITLFDGGYYTEAFDSFKLHKNLGSSDLQLFTTLVWMGHLKDVLKQRDEAIKYYKEALKHDVGRTMRHDQYGMQINRAYVEKRLKEPFTWGKK